MGKMHGDLETIRPDIIIKRRLKWEVEEPWGTDRGMSALFYNQCSQQANSTISLALANTVLMAVSMSN